MAKPKRIPHEEDVRAVVRDEVGAGETGDTSGFVTRGTTEISNLGPSPTAAEVAAKVDEIVNQLRATGVVPAGRF